MYSIRVTSVGHNHNHHGGTLICTVHHNSTVIILYIKGHSCAAIQAIRRLSMKTNTEGYTVHVRYFWSQDRSQSHLSIVSATFDVTVEVAFTTYVLNVNNKLHGTLVWP